MAESSSKEHRSVEQSVGRGGPRSTTDGSFFVALTPTNRFGTGKIVFPSYECANPSCEATFGPRNAGPKCKRCAEPHCPHCGRCACESSTTGKTCPSCFTLLSPAEVINGTHECW